MSKFTKDEYRYAGYWLIIWLFLWVMAIWIDYFRLKLFFTGVIALFVLLAYMRGVELRHKEEDKK